MAELCRRDQKGDDFLKIFLSPAPEQMSEVVILEESLSKVMGTCLLDEEKGRFS
jgi:hypothetical protein